MNAPSLLSAVMIVITISVTYMYYLYIPIISLSILYFPLPLLPSFLLVPLFVPHSPHPSLQPFMPENRPYSGITITHIVVQKHKSKQSHYMQWMRGYYMYMYVHGDREEKWDIEVHFLSRPYPFALLLLLLSPSLLPAQPVNTLLRVEKEEHPWKKIRGPLENQAQGLLTIG